MCVQGCIPSIKGLGAFFRCGFGSGPFCGRETLEERVAAEAEMEDGATMLFFLPLIIRYSAQRRSDVAQ